MYALGKTLKFYNSNGRYEIIVTKSVIGRGVSKKAIFLEDGRVIMLPNTDKMRVIKIAEWWEENIDREVESARVLKDIGIPVLNREKITLMIPSVTEKGVSYKLPVYLSDSFEQYASRGWYVLDIKSYTNVQYSSFFPKTKYFDYSLDAYKGTVKPLIYDLYTAYVSTGFVPGRDCSNQVLIETENSSFQLRYFGFDFGGRYGAVNIRDRSEKINKDSQKICTEISKKCHILIKTFISHALLVKEMINLNLDPRDSESKNSISEEIDKKIIDFSSSAVVVLCSCDFISEVIGQDGVNTHEDL